MLNHRHHGQTQTGTLPFMAPECLRDERYSFPADMWSLGVVMFSMCTGSLPFNEASADRLTRQILNENADFSRIRVNYSREVLNLIQGLLSKDPGARPTINDVMASPSLAARIGNHLTPAQVDEEFVNGPPLQRTQSVRPQRGDPENVAEGFLFPPHSFEFTSFRLFGNLDSALAGVAAQARCRQCDRGGATL